MHGRGMQAFEYGTEPSYEGFNTLGKKGSVNWTRAQVVLMGPLNPLAAPSQILSLVPRVFKNIGELYVNWTIDRGVEALRKGTNLCISRNFDVYPLLFPLLFP